MEGEEKMFRYCLDNGLYLPAKVITTFSFGISYILKGQSSLRPSSIQHHFNSCSFRGGWSN